MKKHSKEYADKLSNDRNAYRGTDAKVKHTISLMKEEFVDGFMTAIEETNHIEVLEICKNIISLKEKALDTKGLFPVLQEIESLKEAIRKAEEELNQSKDV